MLEERNFNPFLDAVFRGARDDVLTCGPVARIPEIFVGVAAEREGVDGPIGQEKAFTSAEKG